VGVGVLLGPLSTASIYRPIVPAPGDYDDGEIGGMMIGRGDRSTRRNPAPVPLCPTQPPHVARTWTRAVEVGSQRSTAGAMARPWIQLSKFGRSPRFGRKKRSPSSGRKVSQARIQRKPKKEGEIYIRGFSELQGSTNQSLPWKRK
jgi:hypothetical protein